MMFVASGVVLKFIAEYRSPNCRRPKDPTFGATSQKESLPKEASM